MFVRTRREIRRSFEHPAGAGLDAKRAASSVTQSLPNQLGLCRPFSGGTTSCDTLWMGVPIVTVPGSRSVSRSASSVLSNLGLSDWIASSPEDYVRRAVRFAGERELLAELRASLRSRMAASPLMDEARFVRDLETAYRQMWRIWCAGEPA